METFKAKLREIGLRKKEPEKKQEEGLEELLDKSPKRDKNFKEGTIEVRGRGKFVAYRTETEGASVNIGILDKITSTPGSVHKMSRVYIRTNGEGVYGLRQYSGDDGKPEWRVSGNRGAGRVLVGSLPEIIVGKELSLSVKDDRLASSIFNEGSNIVNQITVVDTAKNVGGEQSVGIEVDGGGGDFRSGEESPAVAQMKRLEKSPMADENFDYGTVKRRYTNHPAYITDKKGVSIDLDQLGKINVYANRVGYNISEIYIKIGNGLYKLEHSLSGGESQWAVRNSEKTKIGAFVGSFPKIIVGEEAGYLTNDGSRDVVEQIAVVNTAGFVKKDKSIDIADEFDRLGSLPVPPKK